MLVVVAKIPTRELAFIPCGRDGVLEVISVADPAHVTLVQHVPTQTLARTGALDPQSGRIYLMTAVIALSAQAEVTIISSIRLNPAR